MKNTLSILATAISLFAASAQAHFQLIYTPETMLEKPTEIPLDLVFGHPMENGYVMEMGAPEKFSVYFKGKEIDLSGTLKPIVWQGASNQATSYETTYKIKRSGDYIFAVTPAPYLEKSEDLYIQQITKVFVNKGGIPTKWNEPVGLVTEIVPFNKPYQNYVGGTFTGQVLSEGEPAAGIECEIEYINTKVDVVKNTFGKKYLGDVPPTAYVVFTDPNGMFSFGIPKAGRWGFACMGAGPETEYNGKELTQDAILWIDAVELK